jgi:hypothetical protein
VVLWNWKPVMGNVGRSCLWWFCGGRWRCSLTPVGEHETTKWAANWALAPTKAVKQTRGKLLHHSHLIYLVTCVSYIFALRTGSVLCSLVRRQNAYKPYKHTSIAHQLLRVSSWQRALHDDSLASVWCHARDSASWLAVSSKWKEGVSSIRYLKMRHAVETSVTREPHNMGWDNVRC